MLSIMYDRGPEQWDMTDQRLRPATWPAAVEFLSKYCADLKQEFDDLRQPTEFSIGVDYHLVLTKGPIRQTLRFVQEERMESRLES